MRGRFGACCSTGGSAVTVPALDVLRADHSDTNVVLKMTCSPSCVVCAALADLDALVQAAQTVRANFPGTPDRGFVKFEDMIALAGALDRVTGEAR